MSSKPKYDPFATVEHHFGNGKTAYVNRMDAELLSKYHWRYDTSQGYAYYIDPRGERIHLDEVIAQRMTEDAGRKWTGLEAVSHLNKDRLDCRRKNLAVAVHLGFTTNIRRAVFMGFNSHGYTVTTILDGKRMQYGPFEDSVEADAAFVQAFLDVAEAEKPEE